MYYTIYIKYKNKEKEQVWLLYCHNEEVHFQIINLLKINELTNKLEYIRIEECKYERRTDD